MGDKGELGVPETKKVVAGGLGGALLVTLVGVVIAKPYEDFYDWMTGEGEAADGSAQASGDGRGAPSVEPLPPPVSDYGIALSGKGASAKSTELATTITTAIDTRLSPSQLIDKIEYSVGIQTDTPRSAPIGLTIHAGAQSVDCGSETVVFRTSSELARNIADRANRAIAASQSEGSLKCL